MYSQMTSRHHSYCDVQKAICVTGELCELFYANAQGDNSSVQNRMCKKGAPSARKQSRN